MHVRRTLALTFAVPLLLAGCSDEAQPTPKMPDPTTSSLTPSPTESETAQAESAEDFIRRWQAASDEMQRSGETAAYLAISSECTACKSLAENVEAIYADGGRIEFDGSDIVRVQRSGAKPPTYDVDLALARTLIHRPGQAKPQLLPAGEMSIRVTLKKSQGSWVVTHYGVL